MAVELYRSLLDHLIKQDEEVVSRASLAEQLLQLIYDDAVVGEDSIDITMTDDETDEDEDDTGSDLEGFVVDSQSESDYEPSEDEALETSDEEESSDEEEEESSDDEEEEWEEGEADEGVYIKAGNVTIMVDN